MDYYYWTLLKLFLFFLSLKIKVRVTFLQGREQCNRVGLFNIIYMYYVMHLIMYCTCAIIV